MTSRISNTEEESRLVDTQISHHHNQIQSLGTHCSSLAPITLLPVEILCRIFLEVQGRKVFGTVVKDWFLDQYYAEIPRPAIDANLKWIAITQVCRHWRNIAINDKQLWAALPLNNSRWLNVSLERSGMATIPYLTLHIDEIEEDLLPALRSHIPRVSTLIISTLTGVTVPQFLLHLPQSPLQVEALAINFQWKTQHHNEPAHYRDEDPSTVTYLPSNMHSKMPNLRHLRLSGIFVEWNSPLLSNLTTLLISHLQIQMPTPAQLRTMLRSAPVLKRLSLCEVCPSMEQAHDSELAPPTSMRYLENLCITDSLPCLHFFFRSVFLATDRMQGLIILSSESYEAPETWGSDLAHLLAALDQPYVYSIMIMGTATDVRRLEVAQSSGVYTARACKIPSSKRNMAPDERGYAADGKKWLSEDPDALIIDLETPIDEDLDNDDDDGGFMYTNMILSSLFDNLNWAGLRELDLRSIYSSDDSTATVLASTFGTIPQLRIVAVNAHIIRSFISALGMDIDSQPPFNLPLLSFPALRHIIIYSDYPRRPSLKRGEIKALCQSFGQRHLKGICIVSVTLTGRGLPLNFEGLEALGSHVEHVIDKLGEGNDAIDLYDPYKQDWYI